MCHGSSSLQHLSKWLDFVIHLVAIYQTIPNYIFFSIFSASKNAPVKNVEFHFISADLLTERLTSPPLSQTSFLCSFLFLSKLFVIVFLQSLPSQGRNALQGWNKVGYLLVRLPSQNVWANLLLLSSLRVSWSSIVDFFIFFIFS